MAYYRQLGDIPPKRHTQHRNSDGNLYYEELVGEEGFSSDSALLYHRHIPSAITGATDWELRDHTLVANHPLMPRHYKLHDLFDGDQPGAGEDVVQGRRLILGNSDVRLYYVVATEPSPLYRNAIGDECCYVESGEGTVETMFGSLPVRQGDYVMLPRTTVHRWLPENVAEAGPLRVYPIEANSHIAPPNRYLSKYGQLLEHSPFCERDFHAPKDVLLADGTDVEVLTKHRGTGGAIVGSRVVHAQHPFDVVGWDGCLYPYTFNISDYEPLTGRVHQPPPSHQVFEGWNFVICNFVPRKVDYHPLAVPVPYYHSNVDSDEVMFYCGGDYEARKGSGIGQGSISLHPGGHAHGPQPGAVEASLGKDFFDELAVMVDTFKPLDVGEGALAVEDNKYPWSWAGGKK